MSNVSFESLNVGECQATHVQPFSTDMHLFGFECKQSWWLLGVVALTGVIKLFQNWIFTKIGQLQRELLQIEVQERTWCYPKVLRLLFWEFVAGVIGIVSILVITGNNFIIWVSIILFNCLGTAIAYTTVKADHHSTALEFINMLKSYNGTGCEHENTLEAIRLLRLVLLHHEQNYSLRDPKASKKDSANTHVLIVANSSGHLHTKATVKGSSKDPVVGVPVPSAPNPDDMLRLRKLNL